ncbi:MAG: formylglycine-generating enzyme family protein [Bacteroidales bacterium]|jgi:hypothetical protein|nr:formylglycine-generating enzyme family protein [Bacteroidales bacterium]
MKTRSILVVWMLICASVVLDACKKVAPDEIVEDEPKQISDEQREQDLDFFTSEMSGVLESDDPAGNFLAKKEQIEKLESVSDVYMSGDACVIETYQGPRFVFSLNQLPSYFDDETDEDDGGITGSRVSAGGAAHRVAQSATGSGKVAIFNFFSNQNKRKNQNALVDDAKEMFENAGAAVAYYDYTFTYDQLDGILKSPNPFYDVVYIDTHGFYDSKTGYSYMMTGETYNSKATVTDPFTGTEIAAEQTYQYDEYSKVYKRTYSVANLASNTFQKKLVYISSCEALKGSVGWAAPISLIVGWEGSNVVGQAVGLNMFARMLKLKESARTAIKQNGWDATLVKDAGTGAKLGILSGNDFQFPDCAYSTGRQNHNFKFSQPALGQYFTTGLFSKKLIVTGTYPQNISIDNDMQLMICKMVDYNENIPDFSKNPQYVSISKDKFNGGIFSFTLSKPDAGAYFIQFTGVDSEITELIISSKSFYYNLAEDPEVTPFRVTTGEATEITDKRARIHGEITSDGYPITLRGLLYSTVPDILDNGEYTQGIDGVNTDHAIGIPMVELTPGTTYYYVAYAVNSNGKVAFGEEKSFTTEGGDGSAFDSIKMVFVQGGTFTMGCTAEQGGACYDDEKPAHQVTLSDFYIGKYEVTQAQWKAVMGSNPSGFSGCDNCPVEQVSWDDVQEFIQKLNAGTGLNYRLPTEAEWEDAARGGAQSRGYKYSGSNSVDEVAWHWDNSGSKTHPVGTKKANELGIYDMSGNVYEWCSDWYGAYSSEAQTNPKGPSSASDRVLRGGCWYGVSGGCRVSYRSHVTPDYRRGDFVGFRLARSSN